MGFQTPSLSPIVASTKSIMSRACSSSTVMRSAPVNHQQALKALGRVAIVSQPCAKQSFSAPRLRCHATAFRNCHTQRASTIRARCLVTAHPPNVTDQRGLSFPWGHGCQCSTSQPHRPLLAPLFRQSHSRLSAPIARKAAGGTPPVILILPFASCGAPCQSLISRGDLVQTFPALRVRFAVGEGSAVFGQLVPNHGGG